MMMLMLSVILLLQYYHLDADVSDGDVVDDYDVVTAAAFDDDADVYNDSNYSDDNTTDNGLVAADDKDDYDSCFC